MKIKADLKLKETIDGGRKNSISSGYRPTFRINSELNSDCVLLSLDKVVMKPGESGIVDIKILHPEKLKVNEGDLFTLTEGLKEIANGTVLSIKNVSNIIEKLKEISEDNGDDYFDPYSLMNETHNWPDIPCHENHRSDNDYDYDKDGTLINNEETVMEQLDLENCEVTEIGDNYIIIKGGGDWQDPYEVKIELYSNGELQVVEYKPTEFGITKSINMDLLLGFEK